MEKATIELINKFVENIEVAEVDERGNRKFQLPLEQIDDENRRREEALPIDKYDWISFDKIYKALAYPSVEMHIKSCMRVGSATLESMRSNS